MQQQADLALSLQEQLILSDDESDDDGEEGACGETLDEIYDDGKLKKTPGFPIFSLNLLTIS